MAAGIVWTSQKVDVEPGYAGIRIDING